MGPLHPGSEMAVVFQFVEVGLDIRDVESNDGAGLVCVSNYEHRGMHSDHRHIPPIASLPLEPNNHFHTPDPARLAEASQSGAW